jgi:hypothetical protein
MVKVIAMMKRKPGITPAEFARYWYEEHAPLGFEVLPDDIRIRGYVQNYTVRNSGTREIKNRSSMAWWSSVSTTCRSSNAGSRGT